MAVFDRSVFFTLGLLLYVLGVFVLACLLCAKGGGGGVGVGGSNQTDEASLSPPLSPSAYLSMFVCLFFFWCICVCTRARARACVCVYPCTCTCTRTLERANEHQTVRAPNSRSTTSHTLTIGASALHKTWCILLTLPWQQHLPLSPSPLHPFPAPDPQASTA